MEYVFLHLYFWSTTLRKKVAFWTQFFNPSWNIIIILDFLLFYLCSLFSMIIFEYANSVLYNVHNIGGWGIGLDFLYSSILEDS